MWLTLHIKKIKHSYILSSYSFANHHSSIRSSASRPIEEIPSGFSLPVVGSLFSLINFGGPSHLHEYVDKRHEEFGIIFMEKLGPITSIFLSDPLEMRQVFANEGKCPFHVLPQSWLLYNNMYNFQRGLYFMDGDEWLKYRKILNGVLLKPNMVDRAHELCDDVLTDIFSTWDRDYKDGEVLDLEQKLYQLSVTFMVAYLLGAQFTSKKDLFADSIIKLANVVRDVFKYSVALSVVPVSLVAKLHLPLWRRFAESVDSSFNIANNILDDVYHIDGNGIVSALINEGLSEKMISRIVTDLILAAGDTTAVTLQWVLYLLGHHPDVQQRLYNELQATSKPFETTLLKTTIRETLRLYPVAPFITRYLPHNTNIAGYVIPAKKLISLSVYSSSRNEKYFPNAGEFYPDRWNRLPGSNAYVAVNDSYASLPYAAGARSCIGRNLAQGLFLTAIVKILQMYRVEALNTVDVKLNLIVCPSEPIKIRLVKR